MSEVILCTKLNMLSFFDEQGRCVPSTLLSYENVDLVDAVSLNKKFLVLKKKGKNKSNKSLLYQFGLKNPDFKIIYFHPTDTERNDIDSIINSFSKGDIVKVTAKTKSKGFQGVVKRWNFAGGPRTHGQSDRERAPGAIGMRTIPGRVFKGKKMAGKMGGVTKTIKGLTLLSLDTVNKLFLVSGSVPGPSKSVVILSKE